MPLPRILDVTLRDGAYLFDHNIPLSTVRDVASCLDEAGLPYIEAGHGSGIGAREKGFYPNGPSDLDIARSARQAVRKGRLGMLASPLFTTKTQLEALRPFLDFVRIGVNVDRAEDGAPLIHEAKSLGYEVFFQMMRTPRVPPAKAAEGAKFAESAGVDAVYLVDSAGGWSPWQVGDYVKETLSKISVPLGIHAHNHLGVALANSLAALDAGCLWIDASLRGIGRGAGNVQTEILTIHLARLGHRTGIDDEILQVASEIVAEILPPEPRGISPDDYLPANVGIDLYPLPIFVKICREAGVDLRTLIAALGKVRAVEIRPEDLAQALLSIGADPEIVLKRAGFDVPVTKTAPAPSSD